MAMVDRDDDEVWTDETVRNEHGDERATVEERPTPAVAAAAKPSVVDPLGHDTAPDPPKVPLGIHAAATISAQPSTSGAGDPWAGDTQRSDPPKLPAPPGMHSAALNLLPSSSSSGGGDPWSGDTQRSDPPAAAQDAALDEALAEDRRLTDLARATTRVGAVASEAPTLPPPSRPNGLGSIGGYLLKKRLAIGGMAEVFLAELARDGGFRKSVVLKRILPELAEDEHFVQMFLREGRIAARLNHPNVVTVFELAHDGDAYFLVMEYVDGITLADLAYETWRRGRALPMPVVLHAVADAAAGLHYAHELRGDDKELLNLVHRDVSPDNLMVTREGITKVVDFGIARARAERLTDTGEVKGKLSYMAPEQLEGGHDVDRRVDVHALGATMFYLLTSERPWKARSPLALLAAIQSEEPRPPSSVNRFVPPLIDELVLRCLAKDPARRPQSAAELSEELLRLLPSTRQPVSAFVCEVMDLPPVTTAFTAEPGFIAAVPDGLSIVSTPSDVFSTQAPTEHESRATATAADDEDDAPAPQSTTLPAHRAAQLPTARDWRLIGAAAVGAVLLILLLWKLVG